ncbi:TIGR02444 family protein [Pokkaliibacter sp. CJK22405]|uniref:TIGR02444 family protein n=1 Tax=Pokkaliibacter sp. CJK22405 TaxID=3384615 RepID=UPI0039855C49
MKDSQYLQAPAGALWTFACRLYDQPGVMTCCLDAQDQAGLSVNWLLACAWLSSRGQRLDYNVILGATAWQEWHREVTSPLRSARKHLGVQNRQHSLYAVLKNVELDAEREELAMLERCCAPLTAAEQDVDAATLMQDNLLVYLHSTGLQGEAIEHWQQQLIPLRQGSLRLRDELAGP